MRWIFFFFPWMFAPHHADGPLALPDGSVFPPPPPAVLLFRSKMASALEPLVRSCIFSLVVVSVPHGFGTSPSASRHEIPVSSSGKSHVAREGGAFSFPLLSLCACMCVFFFRCFFFSLPPSLAPPEPGPARAFRGEPRAAAGERGNGGMVTAEVGGLVVGGER